MDEGDSRDVSQGCAKGLGLRCYHVAVLICFACIQAFDMCICSDDVLPHRQRWKGMHHREWVLGDCTFSSRTSWRDRRRTEEICLEGIVRGCNIALSLEAGAYINSSTQPRDIAGRKTWTH